MSDLLNKETRAVLGTAADKIGTYDEAPGGGTPLPKGTKAPSKEWVRKNRRNQPRNPDGTFGYNSLNAIELKYGPSRGTTVPDFLKGIELTFLDKGTTLALRGPNGIEYYISTIDMTKEQLIENCKHFIESEEGFAGLHKGMMVKKMGRHSKEEIEKGKELERGEEVVSGKVERKDKPKLSSNTIQKMNMANLDYQAIESQLQGVDAAYLLRNLHLTWGVRDYNKAGATQKDVEDREKWRAALKSGPNVPPGGGGSGDDDGGGGGGGPNVPSSRKAPPSYQGKNVSSSKMGKIKNLLGSLVKK